MYTKGPVQYKYFPSMQLTWVNEQTITMFNPISVDLFDNDADFCTHNWASNKCCIEYL